jgi:hypothetical protein
MMNDAGHFLIVTKIVMAGLVPAIHALPHEERGCPAQGRA